MTLPLVSDGVRGADAHRDRVARAGERELLALAQLLGETFDVAAPAVDLLDAGGRGARGTARSRRWT